MNRVPRLAQLRTDIDCGRSGGKALAPDPAVAPLGTHPAWPWRRGDTGGLHGLGLGGRRNLGFGFGLLEVLRRSGGRQGSAAVVVVHAGAGSCWVNAASH